jgi:hypothetical protein
METMMRDEILRDFVQAAIALATESVRDLRPSALDAVAAAMTSGVWLPEIVFSSALPVIAIRLIHRDGQRQIEISRIENPPGLVSMGSPAG